MDRLVFHPDRPEVLAVLGWKFATLGDPMCDLANNCMSFFLPAHFSARRGTEGAQSPLAHAEEPEFRTDQLLPKQLSWQWGSVQLERALGLQYSPSQSSWEAGQLFWVGML